MLNDTQLREAIGSNMYDRDGNKVGKVGQVFLDDRSGQPEWATVNTGLFGTSESFVPLQDARLEGDRLVVSHEKDKIKDAPTVDVEDGHLDEDEERRLYEYYGRAYDEGPTPAAGLDHEEHRTDHDEPSVTHESRHGRETERGGHEEGAMTLSEEKLHATTRTEESGRARLRKYVVTEQESVTVPVRKEKAVLEREPVTGDHHGESAELSEDEQEVVLHEERPEVEKTVEARERVRLGKESHTEDHNVTEAVRHEDIEVEGEVGGHPDRGH